MEPCSLVKPSSAQTSSRHTSRQLAAAADDRAKLFMPTLNHRGMPMIEPRGSLRRQLAIEDAPATTAADAPARAVDATAVHTPAKAPCPPHAATWHAMSSGGGTVSLAPAPSPWASNSIVAAVAGGLPSPFEGRSIVEKIFVRGRKPAKARALTRANVH